MELHRGRLIDHIQLRCGDLAASKRFYAALLAVLGRELVELAPGLIVADELCLTPAGGGPPAPLSPPLPTDSRPRGDRLPLAPVGGGGPGNRGPPPRGGAPPPH